MICKECGFQNKLRKGNAKYCTNCGTPLYEQKTIKKHSVRNLNKRRSRSRKSMNILASQNSFSVKKLWYGAALVIGAFLIFSISVSNSHKTSLRNQNIVERKSQNLMLEAKVFDIASKFACACGGCDEDPLDKCKCDFADEEREFIRTNLENLNSDDATIEAVNKKYGGLKKS